MEEVIARFAQLTPQERAKRKLESLEALKKTFKKLDHDVNIEDFLGSSNQTIEELHNELRRIQAQLSDVQEKLWYYGNEPEQITSIEQARDVEETIQEALSQMRTHKEAFKSNQLMSLAQASHQLYHSGVRIPLAMEVEHQPQPISWISNNEGQQIMLHEDPSLGIFHRAVDCATDNTLSIPPGYNDLNIKQSNMDESPGQQETFLNELNRSTARRLHLGGQGPLHQPYNHPFTENKKFKPEIDMNLRGIHMDYQNHSLESLGVGFDGVPQQWPTSSNHAVMPLFDKNSFPRHQSIAIIEGTSTSMAQQLESIGHQNSTGL